MFRFAAVKKVLLVIASLLFCEILLRVFGFAPYNQTPFSLESKPTSFLQPHDSFGYALSPGNFKVNVNGLDFFTNHLNSRNRVIPTAIKTDRQTIINIYGCSFAYGFGLNDSATFSAKLQQLLGSAYRVNSFAVPGYGDIQGLIQLQTHIINTQKPDIAIFGFCDFHADRNVLNPNYRIHLKQGINKENIEGRFPFVTKENDVFKIEYESFTKLYKHWIWRENLSLVNLFQTSYDAIFKHCNGIYETQWIYKEIAKTCNEEGIQMVVAPLAWGRNNNEYFDFFREKEITVANISIDLNDSIYTNHPFDTHPNEKATTYFAQTLFETINNLSKSN